jgi:hypothetical protein
MDITDFDIVLMMIISYGLGILSGLTFCAKYRNIFLTRSRSVDNLKQLNHHQETAQPNWNSPVLASAPPPHNPVKLTIE